LQAAVGLAQLGAMEARVAAARARDARYQECLGNVPGVRLGPNSDDEARLWADILVEDRAPVEAALRAAGIGFRNFWHPLHTQAPYCDQTGPFPAADAVSRQGMWLPSHFDITAEHIEQTCEVIRNAVARG